MSIAKTPKPPYYAVIFTSIQSDDTSGYSEMATKMATLAAQQPGYLGIESAREETGITVSYWRDLESIKRCLLYTSPSPRDGLLSRMPSSA